jgi:hypothetical protein
MRFSIVATIFAASVMAQAPPAAPAAPAAPAPPADAAPAPAGAPAPLVVEVDEEGPSSYGFSGYGLVGGVASSLGDITSNTV